MTAAVLHQQRISYSAIYADGLRRPGSALKDKRTLPLVEGKTEVAQVPEAQGGGVPGVAAKKEADHGVSRTCLWRI